VIEVRIDPDRLALLEEIPIGEYSHSEDGILSRLHPQDIFLARAVKLSSDRHYNRVLVVPFLESTSLALLARSIAISCVGERPIIFTKDMGFARDYRRLTRAEPHLSLQGAFPLHNVGIQGRGATTYRARAMHDLLDIERGATLIVDCRGMTKSSIEILIERSSSRNQFLIPLVESVDSVAFKFLTNVGFRALRCDPTRNRIDEECAKFLRPHYLRVNNYSDGVEIVVESLDSEMDELRALESVTRDLRDGPLMREIPPLYFNFIRINTTLQGLLLPFIYYQQASEETGLHWIREWRSYLEFIRRSTMLSSSIRAELNDFHNAFEAVVTKLQETHHPKTEWFLNLIEREDVNDANWMFCRSKLESEAVLIWNRSHRKDTRMPQMIPMERRETLQGGITGTLITPGPLRKRSRWVLSSGVAPLVIIPIFDWEAIWWNVMRIPLIKGGANTSRSIKSDNRDGEYVDLHTPRTLVFPIELEEDGGSFTDSALISTGGFEDIGKPQIIIRTDLGDFSYAEDATVPTMIESRLMDREVLKLRVGDEILVRTDRSVINTKLQVDQLDELSPTFHEAALHAHAWKLVLEGTMNQRGLSPLEFYNEIRDEIGVTLQTFKSWVEGKVISPRRKNFIRLLEVLGMDREAAEKQYNYVRKYRGLRMRAYNYLNRLVRERGTSLRNLIDDAEETTDEIVDFDLLLTLEQLASMTEFATLTDDPKKVGESSDN
jgi:hypothetical protein